MKTGRELAMPLLLAGLPERAWRDASESPLATLSGKTL